jgi:WhiB family redox-sensing transcriptional regulator
VSQPISLPRGPKSSDPATAPGRAFLATPVFEWGDQWRDEASCRESDPALFFPVGSTAVEDIHAAKAVCAGCAVRRACLEFAMRTNQEAGIWGGWTEDERRRLRRRWMAGRGATRTASA